MKFTNIFRFKKPELTDTYSIEHQNENWDIVEENLKNKRESNTNVSIANYLPTITSEVDIRTIVCNIPSGHYSYNKEYNANLLVPDVGCNDTQIYWEKQTHPNGNVYGILTIEGMYGDGRKIKTCSIYNTTQYTNWYEITLARKSSGLVHTLDVDCNTLLEERDYIVSTTTGSKESNVAMNLPPESGYFALLVYATMKYIDNGCTQIAINRDSGNIYVRTYVNKKWSKWKKQFTEDRLVVVENTVSVVIPEDVVLGTIVIPYPEGFTKDNCTILSVVAKNMGYNNIGDYTNFVLSSSETITALKDTGIEITFMQEPGTRTVSYRLALYRFK